MHNKINLKSRFRKAFTMIELIFVIVIMAILSKFGVEFLVQAYNSFIFSKINNELQSNSASAVEFVSTRLQHRIKDSVVMRNTTAGYPGIAKPITDPRDANATVLEWISADADGYRGSWSGAPTNLNLPNWSGIIDLNDCNETTLISKGTDTTKVNALISALSDGNSDMNDSAIYFIGSNWDYNISTTISDQNSSIHPITSVGGQITQFVPDTGAIDFAGVDIWEYYKLVWTAYAVELRDYNDTTNSGTLTLWYDYQPWEGETYNTHAKRNIIMENVSSFQFRSVGSLMKIQVCTKSLLTNEEYSICKEKTIF